MKLTERVKNISPFYVMELLEKARAIEAKGEDIVHMEVGEPGFPTPSFVKKEAVRAIMQDRTFYTHSLGIPELRARVAEHYLETHRVNISAEQIIITNGTSGAFLLLFGALLERGSLLAVSDPGYPCYKNIASFVDADTLQIPVSEDSRFEITVEHLERAERSPDALVLANPSNPTGVIYRNKGLSSLYKFLSLHNSFFIVDEIYSGLPMTKTNDSSCYLGQYHCCKWFFKNICHDRLQARLDGRTRIACKAFTKMRTKSLYLSSLYLAVCRTFRL